jgi:FkbM family methyltransferase
MSILQTYQEQRAGLSRQATLDDLWSCYRLLLGRQPDEHGFDSYARIIERGVSCTELARMFTGSPEYMAKIRQAEDPEIVKAALEAFELYVFKADAVVGEQILSSGVYEPHVTGPMRAVLKPGMAMIDIGANIGYFTILASRAVGDTGAVFAFEPLARNVRLLLANKLLNKADNTTVLPFGASEQQGFVSLMSMGSIASSREVELSDVTQVNSLEFAYVLALDMFIPDDLPIDVIKIDIDGYDFRAMMGARRTLERHHPHVFAEYLPSLLRELSGVEPSDYLELYRSCGYNRFDVLMKDGSILEMGDDIARIANLPAELGVTHVDLHIRCE